MQLRFTIYPMVRCNLSVVILDLLIFLSCQSSHQRESKSRPEDAGSAFIAGNIGETDRSFIVPVLENAARENKNVFLVFGSKSCSPCQRFTRYHNDPVVKSILEKYFYILFIDLFRSSAGKDLYKKFWKPGMPLWVILDSGGNKLIDSDNTGKGDNVGYPYRPEAIEYYIQSIRKAAASMTEEEGQILSGKLKYYGSEGR